MSERLSKSDVAQLLDDDSPEVRARTADKVAREFDSGLLQSHERAIVEDILRIMCRDAELMVREALSRNLKSCPDLPHEIARTLADDIESVALPIIQFSAVLTDEDLIEIVRSQGSAKQKAVAQRETVSSAVADALIEARDREAVTALVENDGADITEQAFGKVIDAFSDVEAINHGMARRASLPMGVAEKLINLVSDQMREHLMTHQELSAETVSDLILASREKATLRLLEGDRHLDSMRELIVKLYKNRRLTPTILLRALFMGDMEFFETSLAVLAQVPLKNARILIHERGDAGLAAILQRATIPDRLYAAIEAAVEVTRETDYDGGENDRERFRKRMIERILTHFEDPARRIDEDDIDYLLGKLTQIDRELSADNAAAL